MRTIPALSIDTKMIQDRLDKAAIGEVITYAELFELIGRDVQNEARGNLTTATRRLVSDGKVFACVRGSGVKRLSDQEIVGIGQETIGKMRRAARRARVKLAAVEDFDAMPRDAKTMHNLSMSVLGVLDHMTRSRTLKQLEARIDEAQKSLPLNKTLEAMSKS